MVLGAGSGNTSKDHGWSANYDRETSRRESKVDWRELVLLIHEAKLGPLVESELETLVLANGATPQVIDRVLQVIQQANALDQEKLSSIQSYLSQVKPEYNRIETVEQEAKEELHKILVQAEA